MFADYILEVTRSGTIKAGNVEPFARAIDAFVLMYQNHAAREDTIVFPAWKTAISQSQLHELGERFEEIEKRQFGTDGFAKAVEQIDGIEQRLGFADLAQFTDPPPPMPV